MDFNLQNPRLLVIRMDSDRSLREWTAEDGVSIRLSPMDQTRGSGEIITLEARIFLIR